MKLTAGALLFDLIKVATLIIAVVLLLDGFFLYFEKDISFADSAHDFLGSYAGYFRFEFLGNQQNKQDNNIYVWNSLLSGIVFITLHFLTEAFQRNFYEGKKK
jgi:Na+-transporting NADH:ubiquinone oxidoreductase subunit NqrB